MGRMERERLVLENPILLISIVRSPKPYYRLLMLAEKTCLPKSLNVGWRLHTECGCMRYAR